MYEYIQNTKRRRGRPARPGPEALSILTRQACWNFWCVCQLLLVASRLSLRSSIKPLVFIYCSETI